MNMAIYWIKLTFTHYNLGKVVIILQQRIRVIHVKSPRDNLKLKIISITLSIKTNIVK